MNYKKKNFLNLKDTLYNTQSIRKCQQEFDKFLTRLKSSAFKRFTVTGELVNNQILHLISFPSQEKISEKLDVSRKHVWDTTELLEEVGFLKKINRGYKKTCIYILNPMFFKFDLRQILIKHFPALKWIPITLLIALQNNQFKKEVTLEERVNFNYQISFTSSKRRDSDLVINNLKKEENTTMVVQEANVYKKAKDLLHLTNVGVAELLVFEESAVCFFMDEYKKLVKTRQLERLKNPFRLLHGRTIAYSKQQKLTLDWNKYYQWRDKLAYKDTDFRTEGEKQRGYVITKENIKNDRKFVGYKKNLPVVKSNQDVKGIEQTECRIIYTIEPNTVQTPQEKIQELEKLIQNDLLAIEELKQKFSNTNDSFMKSIFKSTIGYADRCISVKTLEIEGLKKYITN